MKRCGCCNSRYSLDTYRDLEPCGTWITDDPVIPALEMRNCTCGSTLSICTSLTGDLIAMNAEDIDVD